MMNTLELLVDNTALRQSGAPGLVVGPVHLRMDELHFPSGSWDDFPVPVVAWFAEVISRLMETNEARETVRFLDGPYMVVLEHTGKERWQVELVEDAAQPRMIKRGVVEAATFVVSVINAGESLVDTCRARGWITDDLLRLESLTGRLRDQRDTGLR